MVEYKWPIKWLLFVSSYSPLLFIFSFRFWDKELLFFSLGQYCLLIGLFSIVFLFTALNIQKKVQEPNFIDGKSLEFRNDMISQYVLFYIYPFIALNYSKPWGWFSLILLFFVVGILQVRSNNLFINPILALFGYDIVEIKGETLSRYLITSNSSALNIKKLKGIKLSENFYLEDNNNGSK